METQVQTMARAQRDKWDILGCKPVWERGTVRLPQFIKTFPADLQVTVINSNTNQYEPFLLRSGRPLLASEILPERADLALDENGRLLDQSSFKDNYYVYLETFVLPPGSEITLEPVPNVAKFINAKPDPWSESRGMIEIDFDAKLGEEFRPGKMIDANGEEAELAEDVSDLKTLIAQLASMQIGANEVKVEEVSEPEGVPLHDVAKATEPEDKDMAPCGAYVTKGYVKQHQRHCKQLGCGPLSVNSTGDEAA